MARRVVVVKVQVVGRKGASTLRTLGAEVKLAPPGPPHLRARAGLARCAD